MFFVILFPFLSVPVTSFSIGTEKVIYFLAFSPKEVNCFSSSSANYFMINDNHNQIHYEKLQEFLKLQMLFAAPLYSRV